jgi:hypothetical protein
MANFGDHPGVPKYIPNPDDEDEAQSLKLAETMGWAMSATSYPAQEQASVTAMAYVTNRPDLASLSNEALVARARQLVGPELEAAWTEYCQSVLAASLGPGAVQAICAAIGREGDAVKLLTAVGSIESADAPNQMWAISRTVRNSPALTAAFDAGTDGLLERIAGLDDPAAETFLAQWDDLIAVHGHRGPNEWDLRAHSWTTRPSMPLGMLERMRFQDDSKSPVEAQVRGAAEREALTAEILGMLEGDAEAHGTLAAGIQSAAFFASMREMGKNACIRLIHEAKLALMELGGRMVADGVIDDPQQIFMLTNSTGSSPTRRRCPRPFVIAMRPFSICRPSNRPTSSSSKTGCRRSPPGRCAAGTGRPRRRSAMCCREPWVHPAW